MCLLFLSAVFFQLKYFQCSSRSRLWWGGGTYIRSYILSSGAQGAWSSSYITSMVE